MLKGIEKQDIILPYISSSAYDMQIVIDDKIMTETRRTYDCFIEARKKDVQKMTSAI
jgi:hypothetical protein